jgi:hypothetical protein
VSYLASKAKPTPVLSENLVRAEIIDVLGAPPPGSLDDAPCPHRPHRHVPISLVGASRSSRRGPCSSPSTPRPQPPALGVVLDVAAPPATNIKTGLAALAVPGRFRCRDPEQPPDPEAALGIGRDAEPPILQDRQERRQEVPQNFCASVISQSGFARDIRIGIIPSAELQAERTSDRLAGVRERDEPLTYYVNGL